MHPSSGWELLSSHYYLPNIIPSPQMVEQDSFMYGWVHPPQRQLYEHSVYTLHVELHPS